MKKKHKNHYGSKRNQALRLPTNSHHLLHSFSVLAPVGGYWGACGQERVTSKQHPANRPSQRPRSRSRASHPWRVQAASNTRRLTKPAVPGRTGAPVPLRWEMTSQSAVFLRVSRRSMVCEERSHGTLRRLLGEPDKGGYGHWQVFPEQPDYGFHWLSLLVPRLCSRDRV